MFDVTKVSRDLLQLAHAEEKGFKPLTQAVLQGDCRLAARLLQEGAAVDFSDNKGFTAAHWAAMHPHGPLLKLLAAYGAEMFQKAATGATPMDLLYARLGRTAESVHILPSPWKGQGPISLEEYFQLTGAKFSLYPRYTARALLAVWRHHSTSKGFYPRTCLRTHISRRAMDLQALGGMQQSPFYIQRLQARDDGTKVPKVLEGQWEARASREIAPGEPVAVYSGLVDEQLWVIKEGEPSDRMMDVKGFPAPLCIDAISGDGMAQFINHGPPKLDTLALMHRGVPIVVLYALCPLKEDEMLTYSYDHSERWFRSQRISVTELAPQALRDFIEATDAFKNLPHPSADLQNVSALLKERWHRQMLRYILGARRWKRLIKEGSLVEESIPYARKYLSF